MQINALRACFRNNSLNNSLHIANDLDAMFRKNEFDQVLVAAFAIFQVRVRLADLQLLFTFRKVRATSRRFHLHRLRLFTFTYLLVPIGWFSNDLVITFRT